MGRRGPLFTADDAKAVADKLEAKYEDGRRPHTLAIIYYKGKRITQFGIRRGSKDEGHGHLPKLIYLSPHETRRFADCTLTYEAWVKKMIEKRKIVEDDTDLAN